MKINENDMPKLCEIGFIYGQLVERKKVKMFSDLDEAYTHYIKIYTDWIESKDINSEEEECYITAYAHRIFIEKYSI